MRQAWLQRAHHGIQGWRGAARLLSAAECCAQRVYVCVAVVARTRVCERRCCCAQRVCVSCASPPTRPPAALPAPAGPARSVPPAASTARAPLMASDLSAATVVVDAPENWMDLSEEQLRAFAMAASPTGNHAVPAVVALPASAPSARLPASMPLGSDAYRRARDAGAAEAATTTSGVRTAPAPPPQAKPAAATSAPFASSPMAAAPLKPAAVVLPAAADAVTAPGDSVIATLQQVRCDVIRGC